MGDQRTFQVPQPEPLSRDLDQVAEALLRASREELVEIAKTQNLLECSEESQHSAIIEDNHDMISRISLN